MATYTWSWSVGSEQALGIASPGNDAHATVNSENRTLINNNIPNYSAITNVTFKWDWKTSVPVTKGDGYVYINGSAYGDKTQASNSWVNNVTRTISSDLFQSKKKDAGLPTGDFGLVFKADLARIITIRNVYITWNFTYPTCTITAKVNNSNYGTIETTNFTSGTAFDVTTSSKTYTLTAKPKSGYKFVGWKDNSSLGATRSITISDTSISANSTSLTYEAVFEPSSFTVTFKNENGGEVLSNSYNAGSTLTSIPSLSKDNWTFVGWLPCPVAKKIDGSVLQSQSYTGDNSCFNALNKDYKYTNNLSVHIEAYMKNWSSLVGTDKQIISCTQGGGWAIGDYAGGTEVYSGGAYAGIDLGFSELSSGWHSFDIVFSNGTFSAYIDGVLKSSKTAKGTTISYNSSNTIFVGAEAGSDTSNPQSGLNFIGFISNAFIANQGTKLEFATKNTVVNGNIEYYPVWRLNPVHTITFVNEGTTLQTIQVDHDTIPQYTGSTPTKQNTVSHTFTFTGWTPTIVSATRDAIYSAVFREDLRKYTVIWKNYDGTVLETDTTEYGKMPSYDGATPTKPADSANTYSFAGWHITVSEVQGDIEYVATYTATPIGYTVTWKNWDGTVIETDEKVPYGSMPSYDGPTPTRPPTAQYTYKFIGWDADVIEVTKDVVYTAVYSQIINFYRITTIASPHEGGTISGGNANYEYNHIVTLQAEPNNGYKFVKWSDGVMDSTRTITVVGDETYTAEFKRKNGIYCGNLPINVYIGTQKIHVYIGTELLI